MTTFWWNWESCPANGLHDLIQAYFYRLPEYPYDVQEQARFKTVLVRGKSKSLWSAFSSSRYLHGDLKTILAITHRPNPKAFIEWSFRYKVQLRHFSDLKHVQHLAGKEIQGFREYFTQFADLTDDRLPE